MKEVNGQCLRIMRDYQIGRWVEVREGGWKKVKR